MTDQHPVAGGSGADEYAEWLKAGNARLSSLGGSGAGSNQVDRLDDAYAEIAEARRQLFKMPVTYGGETDLVSMVLRAQNELARRTLSLNELRAALEAAQIELSNAPSWEAVDRLNADLTQTQASLARALAVVEAARGMGDCLLVVGSACDHVRLLNKALRVNDLAAGGEVQGASNRPLSDTPDVSVTERADQGVATDTHAVAPAAGTCEYPAS